MFSINRICGCASPERTPSPPPQSPVSSLPRTQSPPLAPPRPFDTQAQNRPASPERPSAANAPPSSRTSEPSGHYAFDDRKAKPGHDRFDTVPINSLYVDRPKLPSGEDAPLNPERLASIREAIRNGDALPPVAVERGPNRPTSVQDGFHRLEASRREGKSDVRISWKDQGEQAARPEVSGSDSKGAKYIPPHLRNK